MKIIIITIILLCNSLYAGKTLVDEDFNRGRLNTANAYIRKGEIINNGFGNRYFTMKQGEGMLYFPYQKYLNHDVGTVEFDLKYLTSPVDIMKSSCLIFQAHLYGCKAHSNVIELIHGWGRGLFLLVSDKNGKRHIIRYPKVIDWKTGEWHHIAFSWRLNRRKTAEIALYIDYKLVGKLTDLTIEFNQAAQKKAYSVAKPKNVREHVQYSYHFGGAGGKKNYNVAFDNIKVYNYVRRFYGINIAK
ncbi:MAG: hypothetical protein L3J71_13655 [Victivallaceae bacterium]|nr:hypothetical protein [Victivallaceae bacterium]